MSTSVRSNQTPNKSLDRSGGSVFSIETGPAMRSEITPAGQLNRWGSNLSVMKFEILAGLPTSGDWPEQFSATGMGVHREGLVVKFYPDNQSAWVGNFQRGMTDLSDVTEHPNGANAIVIASGQGYVVDIANRQLIECFGGIIDSMFRVPNQNVIIFGD